MDRHPMSPMEVLLTYTPGMVIYSSILEARATIEQVVVGKEVDEVHLLVHTEGGLHQRWSAFACIHEVYDVQQA